MAKLTGALLSLEARGSISKSITYRKFKTLRVASLHKPRRGPSFKTLNARADLMIYLSALWWLSQQFFRAGWLNVTSKKYPSSFQEYLAHNLHALSKQTNLDKFVFTAKRSAYPPPAANVVTTSFGSFTSTVTATPPPGNDTHGLMAWAWIEQGNPQLNFASGVKMGSKPNPPYIHTQTGLISGATYVLGVWQQVITPKGKVIASSTLSQLVVIP